MKVTKKLNVTKEEFFKHLTDGLLEDIRRNDVKIDNLYQEFEYDKTLRTVDKKEKRYIVRLVEYVPSRKFHIHFKNDEETHSISYSLSDYKDGVEVEYSESLIRKRKKSKFLGVILPTFKKKTSKLDLVKNLYNIEKQILNSRANDK